MPGLSFEDTTALIGLTYYYRISALNADGCESIDSDPVVAEMPAGCTPGVAPTLSQPGDKTVIVGNTVLHSITATDSAVDCDPPTFSHTTLPAFITYQDSTGSGSATREYTLQPVNAVQAGTYPIRVTATDSDLITTSITFLVYVGLAGEPNNGTSTPPPSQTNWFIPITDVAETTPDVEARVTWDSDSGMSYDLYSSTTPPGGGGTWSKVSTGVEAAGASTFDDVVGSGEIRFYQVVPQGIPATERGVWGIVRPSVPASSVTYMAPPLPDTESDRRFDGNLGVALAAVLTDPDNRIYVMSTDGSGAYTTLRVANGDWIIDGGGAYTTAFSPGQGFLIVRDSGSASPTFEGPVGNDGGSQVSLTPGYNLIGISEGRVLSAATAFENASPVGSYDEGQADQVIIINSDGSFRRLWRLGNGTWYDTATKGATTLTLQPGQAYCYIRRNTGTTLSF